MNNKKIIEATNRKRLIFTITSGRSGSGLLAKKLSIISKVDSFHEPEPKFSECFPEIKKDKDLAQKFWIENKLPAILQQKNKIYIETSHLFSKGFIEPLIDLGIIPDIFILTRNLRNVAKSLYQLDTIPGKTETGKNWYISPDDKNIFLKLDNYKNYNDYQLCYWYALENIERQNYYKKQFEYLGAKIIGITFEELTSIFNIKRFVSCLSLPKLSILTYIKSILFSENDLISLEKNVIKSSIKNIPFNKSL